MCLLWNEPIAVVERTLRSAWMESRIYIPKGKGKVRPIGISAFEDKLVQDAVRTLDRIVHRGEVGKCLHVGVLDGVELPASESGTAQGSVLSPLLGNVYLHYVLDLWFEQEVKPRLRGRATLVRYADDFVIGFEHEADARRVMDVLPKRVGNYGLTLHPDKTRLLPFRRPPAGQKGGKGPATFDFLGFTFYWARNRKGRWGMLCKTRSASLRRCERQF